MHNPFIGAEIQPKHTYGFLRPWISPWFFVGFLFSLPPYAQLFLRKPRFVVLAYSFPWFLKTKQQLGFLVIVYITFYFILIKVLLRNEDIHTSVRYSYRK
jgi:hypothetical protein